MKQPTLFQMGHPDMPPAAAGPKADDDTSIDARFERFLIDCPDVYPEFVKLALQVKAKGHERYSADSICHVIRWHRETGGASADGFKLNDHFVSRLARKAMAEYPTLQGLFETRRIRS